MERLARSGPAPSTVLDLGCGTGILSIAAARLWPNTRVTAMDHDEAAIQVCKAIIAKNGLAERIRVEHCDAKQLEGKYYLVLANISVEALTELQPIIPKHIDDYGRLILSGFLAGQASPLCRLYTRDLSMEPEFSEEIDGWQALLLRVRE
jgi:ribosomal protein L11 methyltransferase